jgi:hypothetical protein
MDKVMPAFFRSSWGRRIFALTTSTTISTLVAVAFFAAAVSQASARFALCGPASFDASNVWCRAATGYLAVASVAATIAILCALTTLWTLRRYRRQRQPAFVGHLA